MDKIGKLVEICQRRQVRRLALFGSATRSQFDPHTSDVDLLVDFESTSPARHADNFLAYRTIWNVCSALPWSSSNPRPSATPYFRK
ncbi:MAG: nucleotidyltransferase family protein [Terriglobia bacterium]